MQADFSSFSSWDTDSHPTMLKMPMPTTSEETSGPKVKYVYADQDPRYSLPPSPSPSFGHVESLDVTDLLNYMTVVKDTFQNKSEVYDRFLEIMRDFDSQNIDTAGVMQRVSRLFHGDPTLIEGLDPFLPVGYHIGISALNSDTIALEMVDWLPPRPANKRNRRSLTLSEDEKLEREALLDVLLDRSSSEPGHGVNMSINNVVKQVTDTLSKSNIHDQLLRLSVEEAQCTLDFLQDLLNGSSLPTISKRTLLKTSLELTRIHDCVPRCLMLKGFKKSGDYPFALGHFGELWRGQVEGMEVAVKQARVFTSDDNINKVLRQVRREAIIWRQCDHPNVLPFYGIYRDSAPSTYCLVSPFMVNGSLRQYIDKTDDPKRLDLALDITRGMNYLHKMSIVHGDLKGDNILITDDYRAVIADFGISFVMGSTNFATSSSSSSRKGGTLRWQAPEVLNDSRNSLPADVYSLACVYFEVFDGTIPWSGLKDGAVIRNVYYEKKHLPYPNYLGSTGHAELWWEVMTKCWAYEPQDRPTLPDIVASLHMTESVPTTESKWDRSIPTRLHDPLVQIPSGLPHLFDLEGLAIV
ncbi:kinase-like domain-containing protein [Armillaria fumosa]|nr:kinase-like domain-containing protein [Armillaria fumosa]